MCIRDSDNMLGLVREREIFIERANRTRQSMKSFASLDAIRYSGVPTLGPFGLLNFLGDKKRNSKSACHERKTG